MARSSRDYGVGDFVCVQWDDIVTFSGWEDKDTVVATEPHRCTSYGFLTKLTKKFLTLAATKGVAGNVEYNQLISIPIGCVDSIKRLEV